MRSALQKLSARAAELKRDTFALYLAARHPRVPKLAKLLIAATVAYALSPIDLIPDFIPVFGLLDELILLPIAITAVIKMIPADVWEECRERAGAQNSRGLPRSRVAMFVIIAIWIAIAVWTGILAARWFDG